MDAEIENSFNAWDTNKSGGLDLDEMRAAFQSVVGRISEASATLAELEQLFKKHDVYGTGALEMVFPLTPLNMSD